MSKTGNLLLKVGLFLILASCLLLIGSELLTARRQEAAQALAMQIQSHLPAPAEGSPADYSDPAMPVLQLDGTDYSCLVEVPSFGITLPVASLWDSSRVSHYPCRFWGSAYDSTLVIGGSDEKGLLDFCSTIDLGAYVFVTDMTGARYTYTVSRVDRAKHAQTDWLLSDQWDLTLFAQSSLSMEYIALRCSLSMQ